MSLSRSEEMHRLTENVYKVSFQRGPECAPESSGPSWAPAPGLRVWRADLWLWSQVAAPAQGPYAPPRPAPSPSTSGRPPPRRLSQPPRALPSVRLSAPASGGTERCGPGLLCHPVWSAAARSEGNRERGRRGGCRLQRSVALRLLGAVAPWGSSRRCYASLWALSPQQAFPFPQLLYGALMDVAQSGRSSAGRLDGWTDNPSSYVTAEGED